MKRARASRARPGAGRRWRAALKGAREKLSGGWWIALSGWTGGASGRGGGGGGARRIGGACARFRGVAARDGVREARGQRRSGGCWRQDRGRTSGF